MASIEARVVSRSFLLPSFEISRKASTPYPSRLWISRLPAQYSFKESVINSKPGASFPAYLRINETWEGQYPGEDLALVRSTMPASLDELRHEQILYSAFAYRMLICRRPAVPEVCLAALAP